MEKNGSVSIKDKRTFSFDGIVRFSERLKIAMGEMSNHALARQSGLSEASIRKYVKGDSYPTIDNAAKVADACGVSLAWLLTGEGCENDGAHKQLIANKRTQKEAPPDIAYNDAQNGLQLILANLLPEDAEMLFSTLCKVGINGVLARLHAAGEHALSADPETVIRSLDIRESLKEAFCMALEGNEETDREILRRIKSRNRARSPGDHTAATPEPHNNTVTKKQA
ncbi:helix-turn-helix transcriptional regulator [Salmonella enterica subsp. enterica]|nr:helix-turn-helix transcriptional regulator [Salmonella enterica subsp. enterica serovar Reading]EEK7292199.1 helix-turn-helix transcriptional regulator [Salmonella enterica subsp. enterica serovar Montevideo]